MEIVAALCVFGAIIIWVRRSDLSVRLDALERQLADGDDSREPRLKHLESEVQILKARVAVLQRRDADRPAPTTVAAARPASTTTGRVVPPVPDPVLEHPATPTIPPLIERKADPVSIPVTAWLEPDLAAAAWLEPDVAAAVWLEPDVAPAAWADLDATGRRATAAAASASPVSAAASETWWDRKREAAEASTGPGLGHRLLAKLGLAEQGVGQGITLALLQDWVEGRLLAVVGGIAVFLGGVFFLSLAFSRGWITVEMRVGIGLIAGAALMILGELAFSRLRGILAHVLVAVGLAILEVAFLAGTRLFGLFPVEVGLMGAFLAAVAAAVIAVRHDSQLVAAYGLIAVLAAPPMLGASPTMITLLFVAATLVGTTAIALFRTWIWLPPLAFVLAAPQVASFVSGGPEVTQGLIAVAAFWLVNLVAAGGEETRHRTDVLRATTVTLLLADAAFTLWAGFAVLTGPFESFRGTFTLVLGAAHLLVGLGFLVRYGDRHPFGLIVAASGVAAVAMSVPIRFDGAPVPIAWAAEAVALAWVAVMRRHPYSAAVGILLGALSIAHLVIFEYAPIRFGQAATPATPFAGAGGDGVVFWFIIGALLLTGLIVRLAWVRAILAVVGGLVAIYVFTFELSGAGLVAAWALLATTGLVLFHRVVAPNIAPGFRERGIASLHLPATAEWIVDDYAGWLSGQARRAFLATALLAGAGTVLHLVTFEYPLFRLGAGLGRSPFDGEQALSFGVVLAAMAVTGVLLPIGWVRAGLAAAAGALAIYVFPFELSDTPLVAAWAGLATLGLVLDHRLVEPRLSSLHVSPAATGGDEPARDGATTAAWPGPFMQPAFLAAALVAGLLAISHLLAFEYPAAGVAAADRTAPFASNQGLAFVLVLASLGVVAALVRVAWVRVGMAAAAGLLALWVFPFELTSSSLVWAWSVLAIAAFALEALVIEPWAGPEFSDLSTVPALTRLVRPAVRALGALAGSAMAFHIIAFEFPLDRLAREGLAPTPLAGQESLSLLAVLAALAVSGWVMGQRWIRLGMAGIGLTLVVYAAGFEVPRPHVMVAWGVLGVGSVAIVRRLVRVDLLSEARETTMGWLGDRGPFAATALAVTFMVSQALTRAEPIAFARQVVGEAALTGVPFVDERSYVLGLLAATFVALGATWGIPSFLLRGGVAAAVVVAWLLPFEMRPGYAAAGWLALVIAAAWLVRVGAPERRLLGGVAVVVGIFAAVVDLAFVAPPDRLVVDANTTVLGWTYLTDATVGVGALAIALALVVRLHAGHPLARRARWAAGIAGAYLASISVVDWFQAQIPLGVRALSDLQWDAQVGLSVLWAVLGGMGFAGGVVWARPRLRLFGLALLGLAVVKVFLIDLVGMPIEGRVAVLLALGTLLLGSNFVYARLQRPRGPSPTKG